MKTILFLSKCRAFHLSNIIVPPKKFLFKSFQQVLHNLLLDCFIQKDFSEDIFIGFFTLFHYCIVQSHIFWCLSILLLFCLWAVWVNFYITNGYSVFCFKSLSCASSSMFNSFLYNWILVFLSIFYCCICFKNQYRWLSSKSSASASSKSTFEEKFLSQQSQTSGLLLFAIYFYNVWFMMLSWPMSLGILSYVVQFFICNL